MATSEGCGDERADHYRQWAVLIGGGDQGDAGGIAAEDLPVLFPVDGFSHTSTFVSASGPPRLPGTGVGTPSGWDRGAGVTGDVESVKRAS